MRTHCCDHMIRAVSSSCSTHPNRFDCPDAIVEYFPKFDEYGIIVHDGGTSVMGIHFCPWCGAHLPNAKRDRWFDELARRGIDANSDEVPPEFRSDEWWQRTDGTVRQTGEGP